MKAFFIAQFDRLGILASSLCALHCLLLIVLPALPILGLTDYDAGEGHELFDTVAIIASISFGFLAIFNGYNKYHGKMYPFAFLLVATVIYSLRHAFGESLEPYMIAMGAFTVLTAHFINVKLCRGSVSYQLKHQH